MITAYCKSTRRRVKINRWVKYTYRFYFTDGKSKYLSMNVAQLEGQTTEDTIKYLIKNFKENLKIYDDVEKIKLISVDGEKVNAVIE